MGSTVPLAGGIRRPVPGIDVKWSDMRPEVDIKDLFGAIKKRFGADRHKWQNRFEVFVCPQLRILFILTMAWQFSPPLELARLS